MKIDPSHLPRDKQDELRNIAEVTRETVEPDIIVPFGSRARGDWVEDEETGYISDYGFLTKKVKPGPHRSGRPLSAARPR